MAEGVEQIINVPFMGFLRVGDYYNVTNVTLTRRQNGDLFLVPCTPGKAKWNGIIIGTLYSMAQPNGSTTLITDKSYNIMIENGYTP